MKRKLFVGMVLTLVMIATVSMSGCVDINAMEISKSNISMTIHSYDNPLSLQLTGNHINLTIDRSVVLSKVNIVGNYNVLRLSQVHKVAHNFSIVDSGVNTIVEYYD